MANGSVKFPISFPDQREYPTFPSPVSTTLSTITHKYTHTHLHKHVLVLDPEDKDVSFGSLVFRYESRIPNWTGSGKRNNEGKEEEEEERMAARRKFHP